VASLCGFAIPSFLFILKFLLPPLPFPLPLPTFNFSIGLNCDLNNPINVSAGLTWGGGRKPSYDRDPDEAEAA
jgi:hypothetical protein